MIPPLTIRRISLSINHLRNIIFGTGSPVIKLDIINEVREPHRHHEDEGRTGRGTVFESMKKALTAENRIELRGFGVFNVRPRKTGIGPHPRTGAECPIPPGKAVRFKPGKELQSID